jgi:hypothetical protein
MLAVDTFNKAWNYDVLFWNCEHVARLIALGVAHSTQSGNRNWDAENELYYA